MTFVLSGLPNQRGKRALRSVALVKYKLVRIQGQYQKEGFRSYLEIYIKMFPAI